MKTFLSEYGAIFKGNHPQRWTRHIPTGFSGLDKVLNGGLTPGLTILGALSGLGKTTLALQIADQIASRGENALFVSLEMSKKQLAAKAISRRSFLAGGETYGRSSDDLQNFESCQKLDHKAQTIIAQCAEQVETELRSFACVDREDGRWTVSEIQQYIQSEWINPGQPAPVVVIDYLQIIPSDDPRSTDQVKILSDIVLGLRTMAHFFQTPVIVISSINRASYADKIDMGSFKGSGDIEYTADTMIGMQYQGVGDKDFDYYAARQASPRKVEVVLLKDREAAAGAVVAMDYYAKYNQFMEGDGEAKKEWKSTKKATSRSIQKTFVPKPEKKKKAEAAPKVSDQPENKSSILPKGLVNCTKYSDEEIMAIFDGKF